MTRSADPTKVSALVVRSIPFSESSRILTLFCRNEGRVSVMAKGARRAKGGSAIGGGDPPALIEAMVYFKPHRNIQTLGAFSIIEDFSRVKSDLGRYGCAAVILQHLDRCFVDGDSNPTAFAAGLEALLAMASSTGDARISLWRFQLNLFRAIGFELDPFTCPACGRPEALTDFRNPFSLEQGAVYCADCKPSNGQVAYISGESVSILRRLSRGPQIGLNNMRPSEQARREITRILYHFLRHHHPDAGELPTVAMLDKLEADSQPTSAI